MNRSTPLLIPLLSIALVATSLSGCASKRTVSQAQCEIGDWQTLGHRDGALGRRSTQILELSEACVEFGITPDRETYMRGWRDGVAEYCTPSNGYAVGESGRAFNNVCPDDSREAFVRAHERGRSLYAARTRVIDLTTRIEQSTARLEVVRKELISTAAAQLNPILSPSRRAELVAELQGLNDEKNRLTSDIPRLQTERVTAERELADLERTASAY